jgi:hypothetical protein
MLNMPVGAPQKHKPAILPTIFHRAKIFNTREREREREKKTTTYLCHNSLNILYINRSIPPCFNHAHLK